MTGDFSLFDRLALAFQVMASWEVLATLGAFVALWLFVRYVADPWRSEARRRSAGPRMRAAKESGPPAGEAPPDASPDSDDVLPD